MDELWSTPDTGYLVRIAVRMTWAAVLGGLIGAEREYVGKAAGLKTHMMVALGAATFVLIAVESGVTSDGMARVIEGVAAGIGFIGAGTILKREDQSGIQGLTTAATIWLTAAVGAASGAGHGWIASICVVVAWLILTVMNGVSRWLNPNPPTSQEDNSLGKA
jgi:putative Mg2+ transporter-C (MgtC) family protein